MRLKIRFAVESLERRQMLSAAPVYSQLHAFTRGTAGNTPNNGMVMDSTGNLYGTTQGGGLYNDGTVFELSGADHSLYTTLVSFSGYTGTTPGGDPQATLAIDAQGNLYGTTEGVYNLGGTVFELSGVNHSTFNNLAVFPATNFTYPRQEMFSSVVIDDSGNLYGTISYNGTSSNGTIYEISGANHTVFTTLVSFTGISGAYPGATPSGGLTIDSNGNLYGTTFAGGAGNVGTVFELAADGITFTSVYQFSGPGLQGNGGGINPVGGVVLDANGNLFGADGTAVYELSGSTHTSFSVVRYETNDNTALAIDSSGNLFGVSNASSSEFAGELFELPGPGYTSRVNLVALPEYSNFINAAARLLIDGSGNIFGASYQQSPDGLYGLGCAFVVSGPAHTTLTTLFAFNGGDGTDPEGNLVSDSNGNLYGTTTEGGVNGIDAGYGCVYELSGPNHSIYTTLISFTGEGGAFPGANPSTGLTIDGEGNLYGTTENGTGDSSWTVYELSGSDHKTFTSLYQSNNPDTGLILPNEYPINEAGLVLDSNGNIYGLTYGPETSNNNGTVFELSGPNRSTYSTLVSFTGTSGSFPGTSPSSLAIDNNGNLFGTTLSGGASDNGTVFELSGADHSTFTTLVTFTGLSGSFPGNIPDGLLFDPNGNLFGEERGNYIFELSGPGYAIFKNVAQFPGTATSIPGQNLTGGLTFDSSGNLYGMSEWGTPNRQSVYGYTIDGTVFKLSGPGSNTLTSLLTFTSVGGPFPGSLPTGGLTVDSSGNLYGTASGGGAFNGGTLFEINPDGVGSLTATSGSLSVAAPTSGSGPINESFSTVSIAAGASVDLPMATSGHNLIVTSSVTEAGSAGAWTGTLDLGNSDFDVTGGSLSTITDQIKQGFNTAGTNWTGSGITSSAAASDASHLTAIGVIQNNQGGIDLFGATNLFDGTIPGDSDVLAKYTYFGDANLDGKVDASDYSRIDSGYLTHATGWFNGDFNYDGVVNGSDFTLIDNAFNSQGASSNAVVVKPNAELVAVVSDNSHSTQFAALPLRIKSSDEALFISTHAATSVFVSHPVIIPSSIIPVYFYPHRKSAGWPSAWADIAAFTAS